MRIATIARAAALAKLGFIKKQQFKQKIAHDPAAAPAPIDDIDGALGQPEVQELCGRDAECRIVFAADRRNQRPKGAMECGGEQSEAPLFGR